MIQKFRSKEFVIKRAGPYSFLIGIITYYVLYLTDLRSRNPQYNLVEVTISFLLFLFLGIYLLNSNEYLIIFDEKSVTKKYLIFGKKKILFSDIKSIEDLKLVKGSTRPEDFYGYRILSKSNKGIAIPEKHFQENWFEIKKKIESLKKSIN